MPYKFHEIDNFNEYNMPQRCCLEALSGSGRGRSVLNMALKGAVLALLMLLGGAVRGAMPKPVAIAMLLWRGETESDREFMATLRGQGDFQPVFTIMDAQASRTRLAEQVHQVRTHPFDLIYCFGTTVALALQHQINQTPIVFNIVSRPVESGLIASWEHSGNNFTGISNQVAMESAFKTLRLMVSFRKLGFIYNPAEPNSLIQIDEVQRLQKRLGFRLLPAPLPDSSALEPILKGLLSSGVDAVLLPSDSLVQVNGQAIMRFLNKYGIPTIATIPDLVTKNGAFVALGPSYRELGHLAAENALAVLRGQAPSEVPSRQGREMHLTVNLGTAKRLGINLPLQLLKVSELIP